MKCSQYQEDLQKLRRQLLPRKLAYSGIPGYSLTRVLVFGLIFPAVTLSAIFLAIAFVIALSLTVQSALLVVVLIGMGAFGAATILMLRLSRCLEGFARVKKK